MAEVLADIAGMLDYSGEGLVSAVTTDIPLARAQLWDEVREKFALDAVYFKGSVPVVYFKQFTAAPPSPLADLHRKLWNFNKAPLLIAVLPGEVQVFNCFAPPESPTTPGQGLLAAIKLVGDVAEQRRLLEPYSKDRLESAAFGGVEKNPFSRRHRVDQYLLRNLDVVRSQLLEMGLTEHVVNSLVGRSIFIRYLEDRGVLSAQYLNRFGASSYTSLLGAPKLRVYELYDALAERFNGDIFPVDSEETTQVRPLHLEALGAFLSATDMMSGQSFFWAYDFSSIPIELISSIYEQFLREEQRATGAYFTPPEIVNFVLDEVLPWSAPSPEVQILDPACGSGAFLVEAYRRLVNRWRFANRGTRPSVATLRGLLEKCIHGVDINPEAVRVAAFSCYLAMLDFVEPKAIWQQVRFPKLVGTNLFVADFFTVNPESIGAPFQVVVGNPPWQSKLGDGKSYVRDNDLPVGDQQSAQAFLWRSMELLAADGTLGLLMPSKGLLFNSSGPNMRFRQGLFSRVKVRAIVDFSAFRFQLFQNATGPMALIFCDAGTPDSLERAVLYCTPHPSPAGDNLAGIVVSGDEIHTLQVRATLSAPFIWKTTLWGNSRDYLLIRRLSESHQSLSQYASDRAWIVGEGFQVGGGDKHHAPDLADMRLIPTRNLLPFTVTSSNAMRIGTDVFHRPRDRRIYEPPHLLIRRGVLSGRWLASVFLNEAAVFNHSIIGIADPKGSDQPELKILSAFLNSSLGRYYHFLTAVSWGVERDEVELQDYLRFPVALPLSNTAAAAKIAQLVDHAASKGADDNLMVQLDDLVFEAYGLTATEKQVVRDGVSFGIDQYATRRYAIGFDPPSTDQLVNYASAAAAVLNAATESEMRFWPSVYEGSGAYRAVSFDWSVPTDGPSTTSEPSVRVLPGLQAALKELDQQLNPHTPVSYYLRPNIKVFEAGAIHIVKPAELRYWTNSVAYSDADEILAQSLYASWTAVTP